MYEEMQKAARTTAEAIVSRLGTSHEEYTILHSINEIYEALLAFALAIAAEAERATLKRIEAEEEKDE